MFMIESQGRHVAGPVEGDLSGILTILANVVGQYGAPFRVFHGGALVAVIHVDGGIDRYVGGAHPVDGTSKRVGR